MSVKTERKLIIGSGSPLSRHSLNQRNLKAGLEGERRLGIFPARTENQFNQFLKTLESEEIPNRIITKVCYLERNGNTIPGRIGEIALTISSIINLGLKQSPLEFVKMASSYKRFKFLADSRFQNLIPTQLLVNNFLLETKQVKAALSIRKQAALTAKIYAYNIGAVDFSQEPEITAVMSLVALNNISRHIAREVKKDRIGIEKARRMVIIFGQTTKNKLAKL